jgi:hypothetical protein
MLHWKRLPIPVGRCIDDDNGRENTEDIIKAQPGNNSKNSASWLCHNYSDKETKEQMFHLLLDDEIKVLISDLDKIVVDYIGGYDDWYLPSKNELRKMYLYAEANKLIGNDCIGSKVGGVQCFPYGNYWSSTTYCGDYCGDVWYEEFYNNGLLDHCLILLALRCVLFGLLTIYKSLRFRFCRKIMQKD